VQIILVKFCHFIYISANVGIMLNLIDFNLVWKIWAKAETDR